MFFLTFVHPTRRDDTSFIYNQLKYRPCGTWLVVVVVPVGCASLHLRLIKYFPCGKFFEEEKMKKEIKNAVPQEEYKDRVLPFKIEEDTENIYILEQ